MKSHNKSPKVGQQIPSINFAMFPPVVCFRIPSIKLSKLLSRSFWYSIYHSDLSFLLRLQISAVDCSSSGILLRLMYANMFAPLFQHLYVAIVGKEAHDALSFSSFSDQEFSVNITEDFMEYLSDGALAIEVYGHKQSDSPKNPALWDLGIIQAKTRSLRDR